MEPLDEAHKLAVSLFYTDQNAQIIARDLSVTAMTLRKWWVFAFGKEAVSKRGKARNIASNQRRGLSEGQVRLCKCGGVCRPDHYDCNTCSTKAGKQYRSNLSPEAREVYLVRYRGYNGKYRELYPERLLVNKAKERAKRYRIPFGLTTEYVKSCIPVDGCCPITNQLFERGEGKVGPRSMTLDRTLPELGYVTGNVLIVSHLANTIKQNCTDPSVFLRVAEYVELGKLPQCISQVVNLTESYTGHPERGMIKRARRSAKEHRVPFNITAEDIRYCFPADGCCPITKQPFERGKGKVGPRSMSLDRIIPELGYVPGNIAVISHLANTIKQNCTDPDVFRRIADYLERAQEPALKKAG
jgi:hypothetical protein